MVASAKDSGLLAVRQQLSLEGSKWVPACLPAEQKSAAKFRGPRFLVGAAGQQEAWR